MFTGRDPAVWPNDDTLCFRAEKVIITDGIETGVKPKLTAEELYVLSDRSKFTYSDAQKLYESGKYKYDDYVYTDADEKCMVFKNKGVLDPCFSKDDQDEEDET